VVVLHELSRETKEVELVGTKCFREKAAAILENFGYYYNSVAEVSRFDLNLHISPRTTMG
jgi:hypothetical protein